MPIIKVEISSREEISLKEIYDNLTKILKDKNIYTIYQIDKKNYYEHLRYIFNRFFWGCVWSVILIVMSYSAFLQFNIQQEQLINIYSKDRVLISQFKSQPKDNINIILNK